MFFTIDFAIRFLYYLPAYPAYETRLGLLKVVHREHGVESAVRAARLMAWSNPRIIIPGLDPAVVVLGRMADRATPF
jgi:hypothetical protein